MKPYYSEVIIWELVLSLRALGPRGLPVTLDLQHWGKQTHFRGVEPDFDIDAILGIVTLFAISKHFGSTGGVLCYGRCGMCHGVLHCAM